MKNLNPDQLKLFMTGKEWKATVVDSGDRKYTQTTMSEAPKRESMDQLWTRKVEESKEPIVSTKHGAGVYHGMEKVGYNAPREFNSTPQIIYHSERGAVQGDGHHRVAAAADIEEKTGKQTFIPTSYRSFQA